MKKTLGLVCFLVTVVLGDVTPAAGSGYTFKKMWPELDKPWYLVSPYRLMVDGDDNLYVTDMYTYLVQKFSPDGDLLAQWDIHHNGSGGLVAPRGIARDSSGAVYLTDVWNENVQKYSENGTLLAKWGGSGHGPGQMRLPDGITVDAQDRAYVADTYNNRIQKFDTDGNFITAWGGLGTGPGFFDSPADIASDSAGNIYVADTNNHRIQKFTSDGVFLTQWGAEGRSENGKFYYPQGIGVDGAGNIVVGDTGNARIQTFTPDGVFIKKFGTNGKANGLFNWPTDMAFSSTGTMYVADASNDRIQIFSPDGEFVESWGSWGWKQGMFWQPEGIAVGPNGNIYVSEARNDRVQVFSSQGKFLFELGSPGIGPGQFSFPGEIAIDATGNVYVADRAVARIQKFTSDGTFLFEWGKRGASLGEFESVDDIAIDDLGYVYIADIGNSRIQKFTANGEFVLEWKSTGTKDGELTVPYTLAVSPSGVVYVGNYDQCVQAFEPDGTLISSLGFLNQYSVGMCGPSDIAFDSQGNMFLLDNVKNNITHLTPDGAVLSTLGVRGYEPGQFYEPKSMAVHPNGSLYVADTRNNRIQVFTQYKPYNPVYPSKAIIVAGGGNYPGNNLWEATRVCANQAFGFLSLQGYGKETIHYLTSDTAVDPDGNKVFDEADADATTANLEDAILSWAWDTEELILYLTDHGGDGTFKMGEYELLHADELNGWLDELQEQTGIRVIIVYDACQAGSFLGPLASDQYDRIFIASADKDQSAHFTSTGQISFSNFFWTEILSGRDLHDAFINSADAIESVFPSQTPLLNVNGNTVANEIEDIESIKLVNIGNGVLYANDVPVIGGVSDPVSLNGTTQAAIKVEDVSDANGVSKVWAVITPPGAGTADPSQPVVNLPELELTLTQDGTYEGVYNDFTEQGTYKIAVFAKDATGILSWPRHTSVVQTSGPGYATLGYNFKLTMPCLQFLGGCYYLSLKNVPASSGGPGLIWELDPDSVSVNPACSGECAGMDQAFLMSIPKIKFGNGFYEADLEKTPNPQDPFGHYWRLVGTSVKKQ